MKLELTNFRCWRKKTFEFPDEGLVLLSGNSGSGKTSILSAIYFVLYGIGTKIISFGEKKCLVRFLYDGLEISRTKGPNRLLLSFTTGEDKKEYEDDVAQAIIRKKFGTNFLLTSYITQKTVQSFLNLGPNDKMNFLEQLALGEEDIGEVKKRAKEKVREKKDALNQKVGQLELLSSEVGEMKIPDEIPFPLGQKHSDIKIKNEGVFWKRTVKELGEKRELLKKTEGEHSREKVKRAVREGKEGLLKDLQKKQEKIKEEISEIDFDGQEAVDDLKSTLSFLKNKREFSLSSDRYNEEKKRYDELYKIEMSELKSEYERLQGEFNDIRSESFSEEKTREIEEDISLIESVSSLKNEILLLEKTRSSYRDYDRESTIRECEEKIESLQGEISSTERRVDIRCCPNCKVSLRFKEASLVLADGEPVDVDKSKIEIKRIRGEISDSKKTVESLKKEVMSIGYTDGKIKEYKDRLEKKGDLPHKTIEELKVELKKCREEKKAWSELSAGIKSVSSKIKSEDLSSTLKKLKIQVDKREKDLQSIKNQLEDELETDYTEEELREEISKQELCGEKKKSLQKQLDDIEISLNKLKAEIDGVVLSERDFEEEIRGISEEIKESLEREKVHRENDEKIKRYLQYKREEEEYKKWTDKLQKCRGEEEDAKKQLAWVDIFLRKICEAESISVSSVIDNINYTMNKYLEKFFPENPITVLISPYKETKKDIKPSISIVVGYKGVDTSLDSLSGGEYDRVLMALTLSLNELFGSSLILLDESIVSLDSDLTGEILEVVKETLKEKLIIMVAHQISVGVFDAIISTNDNE